MTRQLHFDLSVGQRNEVNQRIGKWSVEVYESGPLVELTALAEFDPVVRSVVEKRLMATTLAIRMEPKVAIDLCEQILALARTKDWRLPPTIEYRAEKR